MLPQLYSDPQVVRQLLEDFEAAEIPWPHKLAWRFGKRFVQNSWEAAHAQLQELRDAGIDDAEILRWTEGACVQTWWVMSADGGGVALDDFTPSSGRVVGQEREAYEAATRQTGTARTVVLTAPSARSADGGAWVAVDLERSEYRQAAAWAEKRHGFAPNFFKAFSLRPQLYPRHQRALELLEALVEGVRQFESKVAPAVCSAPRENHRSSASDGRHRVELPRGADAPGCVHAAPMGPNGRRERAGSARRSAGS